MKKKKKIQRTRTTERTGGATHSLSFKSPQNGLILGRRQADEHSAEDRGAVASTLL